jgi:uncharacterized protein involved in exopolysaccharide biosynthesis
VELDLLRQRTMPSSPEVRQKLQELGALRAQYAQLAVSSPKLRRSEAAEKSESGLFPRFEAVPDLALKYMRLMRDLKVQETLYALLVQQLEQARFEEQKNTPVLSVLDWAEPGEKPVYPRKLLLVLAAALAGAAWVGLIAVVVEKLRARQPDAAEAARMTALRAEWRRLPGWLRRIERFVVP